MDPEGIVSTPESGRRTAVSAGAPGSTTLVPVSRAKDDVSPPADDGPATSGKGRPTPKRKVAEARNKRPLVPADRKAARRATKQRRNELYARQQRAMATGEERYLPPRDKGPVRRWCRNYVDSKFIPSEYFMPLAFLSIATMFAASWLPELALAGMVAMYLGFVIALGFSFGYTFAAKRRIRARFDEKDVPKWTGLYVFLRTFQPRWLRAPKPQVGRGESFE